MVNLNEKMAIDHFYMVAQHNSAILNFQNDGRVSLSLFFYRSQKILPFF
jgi:hypothetical protein